MKRAGGLGLVPVLGLLLGQVQAATGQPATGLLLGLRADRTQAALYRTLYVIDDGHGVQLRAQDRSSVLFHTPGGVFSRAAVTRHSSLDGRFFYETLGVGWAGTVKATPPSFSESVPCVPVNTALSLLFVSPLLISLEGQTFAPQLPSCTEADFFPGAALYHLRLSPPQPDTLQSVFSNELGELGRQAPVSELNTLFSPSAWLTIQAAWRKTFAQLPAATRQELSDTGGNLPDPGSWAVVRRSGRWALRARISGLDFSRTFDVPLPLPVALTGWDTLKVPWATIRARVSDARDAFTSPDGRLLGVMTPRTLNVYRLSSGRFGTAALTVPLEAPESAVSIQWSSGGDVARWATELDRYSVP